MEFTYKYHNWIKDESNQVLIDEEFPLIPPQSPLDSQLIAYVDYNILFSIPLKMKLLLPP
jgi:hypothetical protein